MNEFSSLTISIVSPGYTDESKRFKSGNLLNRTTIVKKNLSLSLVLTLIMISHINKDRQGLICLKLLKKYAKVKISRVVKMVVHIVFLS